MANRDIALNIVNNMTEEQLNSFIILFRDVVSDIPNEETIEAMKEAEDMLSDPNALTFNSVDALFEELMS